jgi:hypothetical protein
MPAIFDLPAVIDLTILGAGIVDLLAIIGITLLGAVLMIVLMGLGAKHDETHSAFILKEGKQFRCYIVLPPEGLYANGWPDDLTSCQVVFITTPVPDLDGTLRALAPKLLRFKAKEGAPKDERIIANVFKTEIGYHSPLRLPKRISGDVEAYTIAVLMGKETRPPGWRPKPFMDIKVVFEGEHIGARRVNYIIPEKYRGEGKDRA